MKPVAAAPLVGRTVLVTRAAHQAQPTVDAIEQRGGRALVLPCLELVWNDANINRALQALQHQPQAELLLTSCNGVESLLAHSSASVLRQMIGRRRVVAVGTRTTDALRALGVVAVETPKLHSQLGVAAWWDQQGWPQQLIFVRADQGRDDLLPLLQQHQCDLQLFACYGSRVPDAPVPDAIVQQLHADSVDAVLLGSLATAEGLIARVGVALARKPVAVAISRRVADASGKLGLRVQVVAAQASFDAMLDRLGDYFGGSV